MLAREIALVNRNLVYCLKRIHEATVAGDWLMAAAMGMSFNVNWERLECLMQRDNARREAIRRAETAPVVRIPLESVAA